MFPNLKITLLDSLQKRINYLNEIIKELELKDIETICIRVEDYAKMQKEKYDIVTARAVSHLGILIETSFPLIKINGYLIAMKGNVETEIKESSKILNLIGGMIVSCYSFELPIENSLRTLVKIVKENETPKKFPRRYDKIKKDYLKK